jgi:hypothetical protein
MALTDSQSPDDLEAIGEFCERHDLRLAGGVPWVAADRERVPVIEWPAAQPVVDAIGALAAALTLPPAVAADGPRCDHRSPGSSS